MRLPTPWFLRAISDLTLLKILLTSELTLFYLILIKLSMLGSHQLIKLQLTSVLPNHVKLRNGRVVHCTSFLKGNKVMCL